MKITFPYWGNYTIILQTLFKKLGLDVIPPERTNSKTIEEGARLAPAMYCFPLKVNIGNYLMAIKKGADTVFMVTSLSGSCRLRYYGAVEEKVLKEAGYKVDFIIFDQNPKDLFNKLKKISGASTGQILETIYLVFKELRLIDSLEKTARYLRPREKIKGKTDEILEKAFFGLEKVNNLTEFRELKNIVFKKISGIEIEKNKDIPKIGLIGEIYTVVDSAINFEIEKKLGKEEIEVHREMDLSYHLKKAIFPWMDWQVKKRAEPYLKSTVGGHGRDAVSEMIDYVKNDFDGVIQLLPLSCMPETTVRPILEKIHKESEIPFLSLSLDEQVAEAGINTRLEAFIDVVRNHHFKNKS